MALVKSVQMPDEVLSIRSIDLVRCLTHVGRGRIHSGWFSLWALSNPGHSILHSFLREGRYSFFIHGIGVLWGSSILYWALRLPNTSPKTVSEAFGCPETLPSPKLLDLVHRMYFYVTRTTSEPLELDPDFTPEEHEEFERLEREHPYVEQHEEKVPVPPRPADARDGKHDVLFLVLFILFAAVFLIVIVFGGGT